MILIKVIGFVDIYGRNVFVLQKRYSNRLIVELEIAAQEEMKITELRMAKLFESKARAAPATSTQQSVDLVKKSEGILQFNKHRLK